MNQREFQHQAAFVQWCGWNEKRLPGLRLAFHCPNGGFRFHATAGRMKALGVRKGVPDWLCPVPRAFHGIHDYIGLAIEFKDKKGKLSPDQAVYHGMLRDAGWCVEVVYSAGEAMAAVERYFAGTA